MVYRVYRRVAGDLILVPECMLVSREAERLFGPLVPYGHIDGDQLPVEIAFEVERQLQAKPYSHLPAALVEELDTVTAAIFG